MSGENVSAKEQLEKVDKALSEYERSKGINAVAPNNEAETYLNIKHDELKNLTPEECGEAAVILAQYAWHIQRAYNEEIARANWAEESARRAIAAELNQYRAASYEERKLLALKGNEYAYKLDQIRSWAKARAERLSYLSNRIEFLARTLIELQQSKRKQNNGG